MSNIVEVQHLTKTYGKTTVIHDISFSIEAGKIYGLLGRNGAGKTTLMKLLTAQVLATSGTIHIFGEEPYENQRVLSQISFLKEDQKYPDRFCLQDVLDLSADLFPSWDHTYAQSLSVDFQMPLKKRIKKFSRGMRSIVNIIVGLASRAPLTILDEPSLGLDAVNRDLFYNRLLDDYAEHPRTILLSTHLIDEVSRLLEHVIVIDNGHILLNTEADTLRGQAYKIMGSAALVNSFITDKRLLAKESFGSLVSATILGQVDTNDSMQARTLGLEFTPISLQQLIVHLTNEKSALEKEIA